MASRRHPALPTLALAAALGTAALATTAAVDQSAARSAGTHSVSASSNGRVTVDDWNTMVPEGVTQDTAS